MRRHALLASILLVGILTGLVGPAQADACSDGLPALQTACSPATDPSVTVHADVQTIPPTDAAPVAHVTRSVVAEGCRPTNLCEYIPTTPPAPGPPPAKARGSTTETKLSPASTSPSTSPDRDPPGEPARDAGGFAYASPDARQHGPLVFRIPHGPGMNYETPDMAVRTAESEDESYTRPAVASANAAPRPMPTPGDALTWATAKTAALLLFLLTPLALYHRIRGAKVTRQRTRAAILEAITGRPGLLTQEAADASGVTYTTADYHLKRLEKAGVVVAETRGGRIRYYPAGAGFTVLKRAEDAALASPERRALLDAVRHHPEGVSKSALARVLGVARSTVDWHLRELLDAGLVRRERIGREVRILAAGTDRPAARNPDAEAATG